MGPADSKLVGAKYLVAILWGYTSTASKLEPVRRVPAQAMVRISNGWPTSPRASYLGATVRRNIPETFRSSAASSAKVNSASASDVRLGTKWKDTNSAGRNPRRSGDWFPGL